MRPISPLSTHTCHSALACRRPEQQRPYTTPPPNRPDPAAAYSAHRGAAAIKATIRSDRSAWPSLLLLAACIAVVSFGIAVGLPVWLQDAGRGCLACSLASGSTYLLYTSRRRPGPPFGEVNILPVRLRRWVLDEDSSRNQTVPAPRKGRAEVWTGPRPQPSLAQLPPFLRYPQGIPPCSPLLKRMGSRPPLLALTCPCRPSARGAVPRRALPQQPVSAPLHLPRPIRPCTAGHNVPGSGAHPHRISYSEKRRLPAKTGASGVP